MKIILNYLRKIKIDQSYLLNLIGPIFYFVLSISSGSICWLSLLTIGDLEWDWREFYWSLSFSIPYLYFLKGGAILSLGLSRMGLVPIGEGEYFIRLSEVELIVEEKSLLIGPVVDIPVYIGNELGIDKLLTPILF